METQSHLRVWHLKIQASGQDGSLPLAHPCHICKTVLERTVSVRGPRHHPCHVGWLALTSSSGGHAQSGCSSTLARVDRLIPLRHRGSAMMARRPSRHAMVGRLRGQKRGRAWAYRSQQGVRRQAYPCVSRTPRRVLGRHGAGALLHAASSRLQLLCPVHWQGTRAKDAIWRRGSVITTSRAKLEISKEGQ